MTKRATKKEATKVLVRASKDTGLGGKEFMKAVQSQYVRKYADDMVKLLEDKRQLEKALASMNRWIEQVEKGNFRALEIYKRKVGGSMSKDAYFDEFAFEDEE